MDKKRGKKSGAPRHFLSAILIIPFSIVLLIILLYTGRLDVDTLRAFLTPGGERDDSQAFTYEPGSQQFFVRTGNGLAIASASGAQLVNANGQMAASQIFAMNMPAASASKSSCVFFDVGGNALRILDMRGSSKIMDTTTPIISVTMNDSGWMAVVTEESGYRGHITAYDQRQEPVFEWLSGSAGSTGYILSARVSPDNKGMAVLSVDSQGGKITFFTFDKEEPVASFITEDELLFDFDYLSTSRVTAVSDGRLVLVNTTGKLIFEYGFDGMHLANYDIHSADFAVLFLEKYRAVGEGVLVTIGSTGNVLGTAETGRSLVSLSAYGRNFLALYGDGVTLYSRSLNVIGENSDTAGLKNAILRAEKEALLISAYYAELYEF